MNDATLSSRPPASAPSPARGRATAILLAAGSGSRLGRGTPKAFAELDGRPLLAFSMEAMARCPRVDRIVVVAPPDRIDEVGEVVARTAPGPAIEAVVPGGRTRRESVRLALEALPSDADVVVCHDAARPFASPALYARVIEAVGPSAAGGEPAHGAIPVIPSPDTVKRVRDGVVVETLPRAGLALAQTPQAFVAEALRDAHRRAPAGGMEATDDSMLLELAGYRVVTVEGEAANFKLTTEADFARAELELRRAR
jgi:2-C-methyl-D-erythritol 4-phosphate cytidylyltransferase